MEKTVDRRELMMPTIVARKKTRKRRESQIEERNQVTLDRVDDLLCER